MRALDPTTLVAHVRSRPSHPAPHRASSQRPRDPGRGRPDRTHRRARFLREDRLARRAERAYGRLALPRAHVVQGKRPQDGGGCQPRLRRHRREPERVHHERAHRLSRACAARAAPRGARDPLRHPPSRAAGEGLRGGEGRDPRGDRDVCRPAVLGRLRGDDGSALRGPPARAPRARHHRDRARALARPDVAVLLRALLRRQHGARRGGPARLRCARRGRGASLRTLERRAPHARASRVEAGPRQHRPAPEAHRARVSPARDVGSFDPGRPPLRSRHPDACPRRRRWIAAPLGARRDRPRGGSELDLRRPRRHRRLDALRGVRSRQDRRDRVRAAP